MLHVLGLLYRNIPACAGKTTCAHPVAISGAEHPRVRGENRPKLAACGACSGTSPRARGKRLLALTLGTTRRNIPACAGKTCHDLQPTNQHQEHPRVRGENVCGFSRGYHPRGTSPRARGKRASSKGFMMVFRNIPACAGKTTPIGPYSLSLTEHPRVRGENRYGDTQNHIARGTSPRARGKRRLRRRRRHFERNIPACAGKTQD